MNPEDIKKLAFEVSRDFKGEFPPGTRTPGNYNAFAREWADTFEVSQEHLDRCKSTDIVIAVDNDNGIFMAEDEALTIEELYHDSLLREIRHGKALKLLPPEVLENLASYLDFEWDN